MEKTTKYPNYWMEKRGKRKTGFPLATLAYYGKDDTIASKVVVAIFQRDGDDPLLAKFFSDDVDLREDAATNQKILDLLQENRIERIYMHDRMFGCPHETGVDYPEGTNCPYCPFWANRDRLTGKVYD